MMQELTQHRQKTQRHEDTGHSQGCGQELMARACLVCRGLGSTPATNRTNQSNTLNPIHTTRKQGDRLVQLLASVYGTGECPA